MTPSPRLPETPQEFLASWSASRGNVRHFLEDHALPSLGEEHQKAAGEAAAAEAVRKAFGIELDQFDLGVESVRGAVEAAGKFHVTAPDPDIPQEVGAAAFFDVDNTLIQGSSLIQLALGLARQRFFRLGEIGPIAWKQIKFRLTGNENPSDVAAGRAQALEIIRGREVDDLIALCEDIVDDRMLDKVWPGTRELAQMHLNAGQQVWLVTATPIQLAHMLAKRLGFTGALGTVPEVKDGRFTGRLVGDILHGPGKMHAVAALSAIEQLDMSTCTAYSDSINDVPMLSMVGTAVAVNPDKQLLAEAQRRGWEVRDYRSLRRAMRTYGLPALGAAAFSYSSWKVMKRRK